MSRRVTIPHVDALDGLRGAAVAGVLLFHGGHLTGGYLGVDLFFVLSGFLITTLLLVEGHDREAINLGGFWARRARRLLPALAGLLVGIALYCVFIAEPAELSQIRSDALSTLFYFANWHSISSGQDYWALFTAPSPLEHSWSLAIEEQFYVVWPLVFVGLLAWWKRKTPQAVLVVSLLGAVLSTALMLALFDPSSPNRVYFGTDTRATGILLGAALAAILAIRGPVQSRGARVGLEVAGWIGAATLAVAWSRLDGQSTHLYRGGFVVCGIAAVLVIAAIMHPQRMALGAVLGFRPLCWLGIISYGLYLWHWPVDVVLDADRTGITGWPLFAVQTAVAVAIAVVSYRFLERPIRRGALTARQWYVVAPVLAATLVVVIVVSTITPSGAPTIAKVETRESNGATNPLGQDIGRVLLVGDSVAQTMASGLRNAGLDVVDAAFPGCKIVRGTLRVDLAEVSTTDCPWAEVWPGQLATNQASVALLETGAFELWDVKPHGADTYLEPGTPEWARYWKGLVQEAIDVLGSTGALVVMPNIACTEPDERTTPETAERSAFNPKRVRAANKILDELAAENAATLVVPDLNGFVCPGGKYTRDLDGVDPVRLDGVHYTTAGSDLVGRWLAREIGEAVSARSSSSTTTTPG